MIISKTFMLHMLSIQVVLFVIGLIWDPSALQAGRAWSFAACATVTWHFSGDRISEVTGVGSLGASLLRGFISSLNPRSLQQIPWGLPTLFAKQFVPVVMVPQFASARSSFSPVKFFEVPFIHTATTSVC